MIDYTSPAEMNAAAAEYQPATPDKPEAERQAAVDAIVAATMRRWQWIRKMFREDRNK
jgi:hypothetical protein